MENQFIIAVSNGNLILAKELYIKGVNINAQDAFISSCCNGHLEVAKWLLSLSQGPLRMPNSNININAANDYAFTESCYYEHFEIIKLLLGTGKISNEMVNMYVKYYNEDIIKQIFDMGYIPLNEKMKEYFEEYTKMKLITKREICKYMIPELVDLIYEYS
jgi:hypothetical protein